MGDGLEAATTENRLHLVTALAVSDAFLTEPVSPELILVSPPEIARIARSQLRDFPRRPVQAAAPARSTRGLDAPALELLGVYLFCLFITLGPLIFTLVAIRSGAPA
jgi:hypothetical protein